jgi:uncharacterized protein with PIN domain
MSAVSFRFYAQLNDFLPEERRGLRFVRVLRGRSSVKDAIEGLGVPHPEIDLILVNGAPVGFEYLLQDDDAVTVYPMFVALDLGDLRRVGAAPPEPLRFVVDVHLQKLASLLRLAGFDTLLCDDDADLADTAARDERVALTRDRELLKRHIIRHGCWIRSPDPPAQFTGLLDRFDLRPQVRPFTRCLLCNAVLQPVSKDAVASRLPRRTRDLFNEFSLCGGCGRVYWRGSHYERLSALLQRLLERSLMPPGTVAR